MSQSNKKTLESYEASVDEYIKNTPNRRGASVEAWIDKSLEAMPAGAKILEIGSAYGRDAKIIEEKGFRVEKTDATKGFVELLSKNDPTARELNLLTDDIVGEYNLIIANAVLLHFDDDDMDCALKKVLGALTDGGRFAFTVKEGDGEAWQSTKGMSPRYFNYWRRDAVIDLLHKVGFSEVDSWVDASDSSSAAWIMVIARRRCATSSS